MGITGLLPLLRPVTTDTNICQFKGLTVGIDTYCWLHKGIYGCSSELCQGIPTDKFIKYCIERVHLLLRHGVQPYLVFDGGYLPAKAGKEEERRARRATNMQRGKQLLREGNASGAHQFFSKAADVTPLMAHQLIQVIRRIPGVKYVVAPYEADAQLGFLFRNGHINAVITEDSDVLLFGCRRVIFKLDRDGTGQEVDLEDVFSRRNDELDMRGMGEDELLIICALSGCDYLPSVHGVGLKKAHRMVTRHKELSKILRATKFESSGGFPPGYEADFQRALLTFRHQQVFDPVSRTVVHMTPLPECLPDVLTMSTDRGTVACQGGLLDFLGPPVAREMGCWVADGEVDPITGEKFANKMSADQKGNGGEEALEERLSDAVASALANWRGGAGSGISSAKSVSSKKRLSAQGNNLTKYWGAPQPRSSAGGGGSLERISAVEAKGTPSQRSGRLSCMSATGTRQGNGNCESTGTLDAGVLHSCSSPAKVKVGANQSCAASPSNCVSPDGFYGGCSPSPSPTAPCTEEVSGIEGNFDPTLSEKPDLQLEERPAEDAVTSKHFTGEAEKGATHPKFTGLRRRVRPHVAQISGAGLERGGDLEMLHSEGDRHSHQRGRESDRDIRSWEAGFAYRDSVNKPAIAAGAASASSCDGRRIKRRRTLGVGSLARRGFIRGLERVAVGNGDNMLGGAGGKGELSRRSRSLGAMPSADGKLGPVVAEEHDSARSGTALNDCVNNLFERFARTAATGPTSGSTRVSAGAVILESRAVDTKSRNVDEMVSAKVGRSSLPIGDIAGQHKKASGEGEGATLKLTELYCDPGSTDNDFARDDGPETRGVHGYAAKEPAELTERSINVAKSTSALGTPLLPRAGDPARVESPNKRGGKKGAAGDEWERTPKFLEADSMRDTSDHKLTQAVSKEAKSSHRGNSPFTERRGGRANTGRLVGVLEEGIAAGDAPHDMFAQFVYSA